MSKVRAEQYTNRLGTGAPEIPYGVTVPEGASIDGAGGLNLTGIATAGTFKGNLTGDVSGNVTGVAATFTGPVTIGGTLTYEDVTNIDAVGLITARDGIKVTGGNIVGNNSTNVSGISSVTATNFYGNGASLSGIEAAPTITGIASTSIAVTNPIVIKQDGTFTTVVGYAASDGPGTQFVGDRYLFARMLYDESTDKWIYMYQRQANSTLYARVGTKVGQTMTWSTPVQSHPSTSSWQAACIIAPGKVIMVSGVLGTVQIGTIDGPNSTISFASGVNCESSVNLRAGGVAICKVADNKAAVIYGTQNSETNTRIITVSGTTPTIHTKNQFVTQETKQNVGGQAIAFDETTQRLVLGSVNNSGNRLMCWAASISGNTITVGTSSGNFDSGQTDYVNLRYSKFLSKVVLFYRDDADGDKGTAHVITTSSENTNIGIGSKLVFTTSSDSVDPNYMDVDFDGKGRFVMTFRNGQDGSKPCFCQGSFSSNGGSIIMKTPVNNRMYDSGGRENWGNPVASDGKGEGRWVAGYAYDTNVDSGYFVIQLTAANFNTGNMVGFPKEAYTTGQTATIKVVGNVATGLSGLTPGKRYYVQFDGTLGTSSMLDNIVVAGQAISSTSLLIQSP